MKHRIMAFVTWLGVMAASAPLPATVRLVADDEARIAQCIAKASSGRPWLEKTLWGLRDQEGGWIGAAVPNRNGTHDLGPLQINSWWVPRLAHVTGRSASSIRYWLQFDACFNVDAARWIFLSGLGGDGEYWKAIGRYHSPDAVRQRRYVLAVAGHLQRRYGKAIFARAGR